jgi:3-polyprenyl-4-hydroxybenzoate decarboxylase
VSAPILSLVGSAAGGVELLRERLVTPLLDQGWQVTVTLTPTAAEWLAADGELSKLADATGQVVRHLPRLPGDASPHPRPDCVAVVPASANTVAKLALGIADNQALTQVCEAIGTREVPVVVFPRVNAGHARQPGWASHLEALTGVGVDLVYGPDIWPLHEPGSAPGREPPWAAILAVITSAVPPPSGRT